jgi:glycosyltransferase involved in cell wall biosynthesis
VKVVLFLRTDASRHAGGQGGKARVYARELERAGVDVTVWESDAQPPGRYDVGHVFNLDWPVETARQLAAARRCCRRVVLSTIHHRDAWMRDLHRNARRGLAGAVAARVSLPTFEALRGVALARRRPAQLPEATRQLVRGVRRTQRRLLELADLHLTLAPGEHTSLEEDFGFSGPSVIIPNGASSADVPLPAGLPEEYLLTVGRVEARKNQLLLASVAEGLDLPVVLVGPPNPRHAALVQELRAQVQRTSRLIWLEDVPRDQVLSMVAKASAHVLPSWCEVLPQVDFEAAIANTRVVTTTRGYTNEYLGDGAEYWDPSEGADGLRRAIQAALARPAPAVDAARFDWGRVGEQLLAAYEEALAR